MCGTFNFNGRMKDLTGQEFGYYTAVKPLYKNNSNQVVWLFKCRCGNQNELPAARVLSGGNKSCGCYQKEYVANYSKNRFSKRRDSFVGKKYGKLLILSVNLDNDSEKTLRTFAKCVCDCGTNVYRPLRFLTTGNTKSCGCHRKGEGNHMWNPDREYIKQVKIIRGACNSTIARLINPYFKNDFSDIPSRLGYSYKELAVHLESQFDEKMNWNNHGSYWHIDHIIPVSYFIKRGIVDLKIINALDNLRPLEAKANLRKGDRLMGDDSKLS